MCVCYSLTIALLSTLYHLSMFLTHLNIESALSEWVSDFLHVRTQFVKIGPHRSKTIIIYINKGRPKVAFFCHYYTVYFNMTLK